MNGTNPVAEVFVKEFLDRQFGRRFVRRNPYRFMFESSDTIVYVQNFNKKTELLWYRVTKPAWQKLLQSSMKERWLCFTNPAEKYAYVIPIDEVQKQIGSCGWNRDYLEVHINPANSRWSELDWKIEAYFRNL